MAAWGPQLQGAAVPRCPLPRAKEQAKEHVQMLHITPGRQESAERLSLSPSPGLGLDRVPWLNGGPAPHYLARMGVWEGASLP